MTTQDLDALVRRFTPKQRAKLDRFDRLPWCWFLSDERYRALVDEYDRDAQKRYWRVLSAVTSYQGDDYRVQLAGQKTWVRATRLQYDQAATLGLSRSIGVPCV